MKSTKSPENRDAPFLDEKLRCVILAAGMGTRLGLSEPKALTPLADGRTIIDRQLRRLRNAFGEDVDITIVVGYRADRFAFLSQSVALVTNARFAVTNTSKSLLIALENVGPGPVLWLNGDVVFHETILGRVKAAVENDESFMVVNQAETGDEEVKYEVDENRRIVKVGKGLTVARGEAVGINGVSAKDRPLLVEALQQVSDSAYFEDAIQALTLDGRASFVTVEVTDEEAVEIDTEEDLRVVVEHMRLSGL